MIHHSVSRRTLLGAAAAVPTAGVLAGCSGEETPAAASEPARVRILTGLGFQAWEAYLDVAINKGWFDEEQLEVEMLPGEGTGGNLQLLAGGQAEFATLDVSAAIMAYAPPDDAEPVTDFVLTSVLHANLLACIYALESGGISAPQDLEGTTIAVIPGGTNTVLFPAFAELAGFDPDSCELVGMPPPAFNAAMLEGQVDATMGFILERSGTETEIGEPLVAFPYADFVSDVYGSGIGVTRDYAASNPGVVRRFNRAALRGLQYAIDAPQDAGRIHMERHEDSFAADVEAAASANEAMARYVYPPEDGPLGAFSRLQLAKNIALLESLGVVAPGVTPEDVADFTLLGDE